MHRVITGSLSAILLVLLVVPTVHAQVDDHLKCYKIRDELKLRGIVDLDSAQLGIESGCKVSKAKLFCVPVTGTVIQAQDQGTGAITPLPVFGPPAPGDRVCYKVKCPRPSTPIPNQEISDQFGNRNLSRFKASLLCTPAVTGPPPRSVQIRLGLCDFGTPPLTNQNLNFVASHYNSIVVGPTANVAALKTTNPGTVMYAYFDIMLTPVAEQNRYTEDMFMHDPDTGQRLSTFTNGEDHYFMDPGSPTWRQFAADYLTGEIARGFDGAHLDDVWGDWAHPFRPHPAIFASTPAWYNAAAFRSSVQGMLNFINTQLSPAPVIFNGYGPISLDPATPFEEIAYVPGTEGLVLEGFVFDNRFGGGFVSPDQWQIIMNGYLALPQNKSIGVISYGSQTDTAARLFSLASYLLGVRDNSTFAYTPQCDVLTYLPEFNIDLGMPLETFSTIDQAFVAPDNVYMRRFANGLVLVNPSVSPTATITLPSTMQRAVLHGGNVPELGGDGWISFVPALELSLAPGEAAVLLQRAGTCQCP